MLNQKREIRLLESNLQAAERSLESVKNSSVPHEKVEEQIQKHIEVFKGDINLFREENNTLRSKLQNLASENLHRDRELGENRICLQEAKMNLKEKEEEIKNLLGDMREVKKSESSLISIINDIKSSNLRLEQKMADIEQDYIYRLEENTQ